LTISKQADELRNLPGKESENSNCPFDARRRLLDFTLAAPVTEVHDDNEQRHQHPDDWNTGPEHQ